MTSLLDGRALLAGGGSTFIINNPSNPDDPRNQYGSERAEIYDPAAGVFTAVGSMTKGRYDSNAIRLNDGRVLMVGGGWRQYAQASAELFDPRSLTFKSTGPMAVARSEPAVALLRDGRVLVAGGFDKTGGAMYTAEIYDPATGSFQATGNVLVARESASATTLPSGEVLIVAGRAEGNVLTRAAEVFDPSSGQFRRVGDTFFPHDFGAATLLADGRVLLTSGGGALRDTNKASHVAEVFDPISGGFRAVGPLVEGRAYHTSTLLADGRVLIAGGRSTVLSGGPDYAPVKTTELFDPRTNSFEASSELTFSGEASLAARLASGGVLVYGESREGSSRVQHADVCS